MDILKQKNFTLLASAKFISLFGTQMQNFALCLYVLKVTGSATKFASVLAVALIPQIILGPFAGVFVDWVDKKKALIILDFLAGVVVCLFAFYLKMHGSLSIGLIYLLVIILAVNSIFFIPAMSVTVPSIVKREDLIKANSIMSLVTSICILISPVIAGILFSFYGLFIILIINFLSFIVASLIDSFINIPLISKELVKFNVKNLFEDFNEGFKFIKSRKIMVVLMLVALFSNIIVDSIITVGVPYISKQVLLISDFQYGMLQSIALSSLIFGPIICGTLCKKFPLMKVLYMALTIVAISIGSMVVIFSNEFLKMFKGTLAPYIGIIIILFIINLMILICSIILRTVLQHLTPINILGRVGALLESISMIAMPLGVLVYGILFDKVSVSVCTGISVILIVALLIIIKPVLYNESEDTILELDTV
jgi:MFS family permease